MLIFELHKGSKGDQDRDILECPKGLFEYIPVWCYSVIAEDRWVLRACRKNADDAFIPVENSCRGNCNWKG